MPAPIPKKISQILPTFQNVAQTSNYLVKFSLPPHTNNDGYSLGHHLRRKGVDFRFVGDQIGMLLLMVLVIIKVLLKDLLTLEILLKYH